MGNKTIQVICMNLQAVGQFCLRHGVAAEALELSRETEKLLFEMREGLAGRPSSLYMIPTYLSGDPVYGTGECAIVMDAGGTNFRIAAVTFEAGGGVRVEGFRKAPMPGTHGAISCDAFFDCIAEFIRDYQEHSDRVGFCFSFPTEILPNRDGRILGFSKEVEVPDAAGRLIGEGVNAALARMGIAPKRFSILNDTVAAMLCGIGEADRAYDGYIGFILGTGTNTCYLERREEIGKIGGGRGSMAVNMESGCYSGFPQGDFDRALDAASQNPGDHLAEKMLGGVYLGELISRALHAAAAEGLFSEAVRCALPEERYYTMPEISAFLAGEGPLADLCGTESDREVLTALIRNFMDRAARITAVTFAAILQKTGQGKDPARPVSILAEGTTFYRAPFFREYLDRYLEEYLAGELGFHCEIRSAEDATLIGTAVAALCQE
ncbi:MAG: hexokinase [Ruminococcaceae bacterium]|nr:hexokinase [Oscillospiraceae bacterium]